MSVNIEGNVSQVGLGNNWFRNVKAGGQQEKAAPQPKADDAVKVSISQEGIENYRKQLHESGLNHRRVHSPRLAACLLMPNGVRLGLIPRPRSGASHGLGDAGLPRGVSLGAALIRSN